MAHFCCCWLSQIYPAAKRRGIAAGGDVENEIFATIFGEDGFGACRVSAVTHAVSTGEVVDD